MSMYLIAFGKSIKYGCSAVGLIALLSTLAFPPFSAAAETPPSAGSVEAAAPTRIELAVSGFYTPQKSEAPKPGEAPPDHSGQAAQIAIDKAIKMNGDFAAKWPKCHFHVASIAPVENVLNAPQPMPIPQPNAARQPIPQMSAPQQLQLPMGGASSFVSLRVTFVGESGCLMPAK